MKQVYKDTKADGSGVQSFKTTREKTDLFLRWNPNNIGRVINGEIKGPFFHGVNDITMSWWNNDSHWLQAKELGTKAASHISSFLYLNFGSPMQGCQAAVQWADLRVCLHFKAFMRNGTDWPSVSSPPSLVEENPFTLLCSVWGPNCAKK